MAKSFNFFCRKLAETVDNYFTGFRRNPQVRREI